MPFFKLALTRDSAYRVQISCLQRSVYEVMLKPAGTARIACRAVTVIRNGKIGDFFIWWLGKVTAISLARIWYLLHWFATCEYFNVLYFVLIFILLQSSNCSYVYSVNNICLSYYLLRHCRIDIKQKIPYYFITKSHFTIILVASYGR